MKMNTGEQSHPLLIARPKIPVSKYQLPISLGLLPFKALFAGRTFGLKREGTTALINQAPMGGEGYNNIKHNPVCRGMVRLKTNS